MIANLNGFRTYSERFDLGRYLLMDDNLNK